MHVLAPEIDQSLYQNRKEFAAERVYEVTTQQNNLPFGNAIADIEQSVPFGLAVGLTAEVLAGISPDADALRDAKGDAR